MTERTEDEPQPALAPAAAAGGRFGASIRNSGYLRKWLLLGITIGVVAGLGAVVFYLVLKYTGEFLLGYPCRLPHPDAEKAAATGRPASYVRGRFRW